MKKKTKTSLPDLVYIYRRRPDGDETEIRYSVRSAAKNLKFRKLFIVGDKPFGLKNFTLIKHRGPTSKYENAFEKIIRAAEDDRVSDEFVLMNDDFFILRPFKKVPYYKKAEFGSWSAKWPLKHAHYYRKIRKTLSVVGPKAGVFEVHFPFPFRKRNLLRLKKKYRLPCDLMLRSLYAHEYKIKGQWIKDYKVLAREDIVENGFFDRPFISTADEFSTKKYFIKAMDERFPKKCIFER